MNKAPDELVLGRVFSEALDHVQFIPSRPQTKFVTARTHEVTSNCPVTGQPDLYEVEIRYENVGALVESKALKLFLGRYRDLMISCEDLSADIAQRLANDIAEYTGNHATVWVKVTQQPRGGIVLIGESEAGYFPDYTFPEVGNIRDKEGK